VLVTVRNLTKRFGSKIAVDDLCFDVRPGVVTGFLGPNGSGKSTTMRCMLGLDRADGGAVSFGGKRFGELRAPLLQVGALLDASYVHPGRTARNHLRWLALSNGLPVRRVDEVLELVGLGSVASTRVKKFSLGMKQRLGLAAVMLGNPQVVILDEPANGLDPEGIRWIRDVMVHLASQGGTVLVSSHQLSEMALMADDLVVIGQGRLVEQCRADDFVTRYARRWVRVVSPQAMVLAPLVEAAGARIEWRGPDAFDAHGVDSDVIGEAAARSGVTLHELAPQTGSLEDAYMEATAAAQEFRAQVSPRPPLDGVS
jgi:ABC-2 type transport system ATP-binding protein